MFVSLASATGQALDLPIFFRSVAESLTFLNESQLPLEFNDGLLATLDNGCDSDSPAALATSYACDWWNAVAEPSPDRKLTLHNLEFALVHHGTQRPYTVAHPIPTFLPLGHVVANLTCETCWQYRDLASDAVAELQGIFTFTQATETLVHNRWETDIRRAQGLHTLYNAILQKEIDSPDTNTIKVSTSALPLASMSALAICPPQINNVRVHRTSQCVFNSATAELACLQVMPPGSHKWTWGAELSVDDVRQLVPLPGPSTGPHSGYNNSLLHSKYRGKYSTFHTPTSVGPGDRFSHVMNDAWRYSELPASN